MDSSNDIVWKVVLCGDPEVGKTQLMQRIVEDNFDFEYTPTIGVDFGIKRYSTVNAAVLLKLQVWDLAGQVRFRSIIPAYFRQSHLTFVVYDVTNLESADDNPSSTWYNYAAQPGSPSDHPFVVVLGNKADLLPDGGASLMTSAALQQGALPARAVADSTAAVQAAAAFCAQEQLPHYVVSAKTGAGVEGMIREAVDASLRVRGYPSSAMKGGVRLPFK